MQDHATEAYLSALIDSTEDFIWSVDLDFKIVVFNRATARSFEAHYGRPLSPGVRHHEQVPPEQGVQWAAYYQRAISEGPFQTERTFPDGPTRDLSFSPIIVDGAITGISVFGKDVTKRKAEEKARLEAERKYREIFDGALEGIYRTTPEGKYLAANPAMARILGYDSPEDLIASVDDLARDVWFDPEERTLYGRALEEHGAIRDYVCRFKRKGGEVVWFSLSTKRVADAGGQTLYYEGFVEEITRQKRSEMEIQQREEHLKQAELLAQMGHSTWDVDSHTMTWSDGIYRIMGWDPAKPTPLPEERARLYSPESWARLNDATQRTLATGEPYDLEVQIVRSDGSLRWVRALGQVVRNDIGRIYRVIGTLQDITGQREEEKARLEAERKYRDIFNSALEGIFQVSTDGHILTANPALATMLGYDSSEELVALAGEPRGAVWGDPEQVSKYVQLLEENGVVRGFETQFRRKDGTLICVSFNCRKALAIDGKTPINEGFIEDITDRKLAELRILERDNKLKEAEKLAHLGHFSWDTEANTATWSQGLYKITGCDPNQPPPRLLRSLLQTIHS